MRRVRQFIERYAQSAESILIVGPTGTGKELVARHIHVRSGRGGRFVPVNCAALPHEMAESLLFGHRRGAFSSAVETRRGYVDCADGGTLFLDEALCLAPESQAKVLRALDTGEIQPLGEDMEHFIDLRVVAAAQEGVWGQLAHGSLRADLYQRIASIVIELPPLAHRPQDIIPIARYFTELEGRSLELGAAQVLERHAWPGNVRELRQVIARAGCLVANGTISAGALTEAIEIGAHPELSASAARPPRKPRTFSRAEVLAACEAGGWKAREAADVLGVSRTTLFQWLRNYGLALHSSRSHGRVREFSSD